MCTMIFESTPVTGSGKGANGSWFNVTHANVAYDHATAGQFDHALLIDFVNPELGPSARVAIELDIKSGRALIAQIEAAITAADESGASKFG
jgi:hypothetical protein